MIKQMLAFMFIVFPLADLHGSKERHVVRIVSPIVNYDTAINSNTIPPTNMYQARFLILGAGISP